jgi:hypothetical protein
MQMQGYRLVQWYGAVKMSGAAALLLIYTFTGYTVSVSPIYC